MGAVRPTAARQGLPVGALTTSCHSGSLRASPPQAHLYLRSSGGQRQGVSPLPHLHAGKVPLWAALDTAALGDWKRGPAVTTWDKAN